MSTTSASQKRSKSRPVDLPGFTGKADRLGLDKTVVKKRKQPATGVKQEEPRRKKPRSEQKRGQRVSQESGDARLPVHRPSFEVATCSAELATGRTKLAVNREELAGIETEVEPGQDEVKVEMSESDHSCRRTLTDLPVELLLQIHELAGSSELPCVSRYIHAALSDHTPLQAVQWLINRYGAQGPQRFLSLALRHPICDFTLMQLINYHWEELVLWHRADLKMRPILSPIGKALLPMYSYLRNDPFGRLPCDNVPRRVFRIPPREGDEHAERAGPEALASYILSKYVVSEKVLSYGIRHAVYTNQADWARSFIEYGGNPFDKGGLALEIAMRRGDLDMVRVLVETHIATKGCRRKVQTNSAVITDEIKALILKFATREILDYFVKERKVKLSLGSILAL